MRFAFLLSLSVFWRVESVDAQRPAVPTLPAYVRFVGWRARSFAKGMGVGCVSIGALFGFLAFGSSNDPDALVRGKGVIVVGVVAGCSVGALGGLVVTALGRHTWEPIVLPSE